jgi:hypothetical protein
LVVLLLISSFVCEKGASCGFMAKSPLFTSSSSHLAASKLFCFIGRAFSTVSFLITSIFGFLDAFWLFTGVFLLFPFF